MIQFNLLPDIKQQYIKAQQTRRLIISVSIIVSAAALAVLVLMFSYVHVVQKKQLSNADDDIKKSTKALKAIPEIDKILTVQNQLNSLTTLHDQKPAVSRLYDYLEQVTPTKANISNLSMDFIEGTNAVSLTGGADKISTINKFADTLKFTTYNNYTDDTKDMKAFPNVVLTSFGTADGKASYTLTFNYDPVIFDITKKVKLVVPHIITTRSEGDKPAGALFQESQQPGAGVNNGQ